MFLQFFWIKRSKSRSFLNWCVVVQK
jgi:hypothetical protein